MIKFSIVVPVYNVENYLHKCVSSILSQPFKNYELILVNDGSTDQSAKICDDYAIKYDNINVIHKTNGGLSDARNVGISKASGDYIVFVDSDDFIEEGTLEDFSKILVESSMPDILITRLMEVHEGSRIEYKDVDIPVDLLKNGRKAIVVDWIFNKSQNTWPAVRYIVRRGLINKYGLRFAYGYLHEDLDWTSQLFLYANSFTCSDFYWYNHRIGRRGSITSSMGVKNTHDIIKLVAKNVNNQKYKNFNKGTRRIVFRRLVSSLFASLSSYKYFSQEDKNFIVELLCQNRFVFQYAHALRHKLFVLFCNLFGFRAGLCIMGYIHKT